MRRCVQSLARKQSHCHEPDWGPSSRGPQRTAGPAPGLTVSWCLWDGHRMPKLFHWLGPHSGSGAAVAKAESQTLSGSNGDLARSEKCWGVPQVGTRAAPPATEAGTRAPPWGLQETCGAGRRPSLPALLGPGLGAPLCAAGQVKQVPPPGPSDVPGATQGPSPGRRPWGAAPGPPAGSA